CTRRRFTRRHGSGASSAGAGSPEAIGLGVTTRRLAEDAPEPGPQPPRAPLAGATTLAHRLVDLVAHVLPRRTMQAALRVGLGADEERHTALLWAVAGRALAGCGVDVAPDDVLGDGEAAVGIGARRGLHEVRPDRQRR